MSWCKIKKCNEKKNQLVNYEVATVLREARAETRLTWKEAWRSERSTLGGDDPPADADPANALVDDSALTYGLN